LRTILAARTVRTALSHLCTPYVFRRRAITVVIPGLRLAAHPGMTAVMDALPTHHRSVIRLTSRTSPRH
jgi:hypothetical protein